MAGADTVSAAAVDAVYAALAHGDEDALAALLTLDFEARFAEGMPVGGGVRRGRQAAIERWWTIGRAWAVRAEPAERIPCADGRLLVTGRYRGTRRGEPGHVVDAAFAHLWSAAGGRLARLEQVTDTARWLDGRG